MKFKYLIISSVSVILIMGLFWIYKNNSKGSEVNLQDYSVIYADTEETLEKGLSEREKLDEKSLMLFVFKRPGTYGFWMKDMKFNIDIIWLDENYKVVHIEENLSPETYPKIFYPKSKALYVVETNPNFVKSYGIKLGNTLVFSQKK